MTGLGHSIAANKVPGVYAALVYTTEAAILSRQHNDSNVLVLGSKFVDEVIRPERLLRFGCQPSLKADGICAAKNKFKI